MAEPILSVRDLSIVYQARRGQVQAVRDISFEVQRGEALARPRPEGGVRRI